MSDVAEVYVGIGSNVRPEEHVPQALAALAQRFGAVARSQAYRNPAVGFQGDDFVNLVARFRTTDSVTEVGLALAEIEGACGRERGGARFAPRSLDLDLLLYGDLVTGSLPVLPREEILERAFVLGPLAELAPDLVHPTEGLTMAELWQRFEGERGALAVVEL